MDFLRRQSFWVVLGGLLVVALVVYLAGVRRLAGRDAQLGRELADADKQVKDLSASTDLPSEKWVEAAEQYEKDLQGDYQKTLDLIQAQAVDVYKTLPNIQPADCVPCKDKEGKEYALPTGAVFKTRYPEAVAELARRLQGAHIAVRPQGIGLPLLTGAIPSDDVIVSLQKRYWLLSDVVDALAQGRVPVDEVLLLTEEAGAEAGEFGPPGSEGMRGGMGEAVTMEEATPTEELFDFRRLGGGEGESAGMVSLQRSGGPANVGVTTAMQELFFGSQRRVRLVAQLDFRELPVLIQAVSNMPRLTLVRTVSVYRMSGYGDAALKPVVRVDIRALCFDRYTKFVPTAGGVRP